MFVSAGESSGSPIEYREAYYDTLFQGELPYEPLPDDAHVGIAGLSRITRRAGYRSPELQSRLDKLPTLIDTVLFEHDLAASSEDGEAIFSFVNDETKKLVAGIVTDIFSQWEVTHNRHRLGPLLPDASSPSKWLVVETAAAVMAASGNQNGFNLGKNSSDSKFIARVISCWGPEFICQWFNGTILNQWADRQQLPPAERAEWLDTFTPGIRKRVAVGYISDPLKALETVKHHLEVTLSDANIAEHLDWSEAEVAEIFTPGIRKQFAVGNISDPLKALETVKRHLEETLITANIAKHLDWSEAEVAKIFTPSDYKRLAVSNISDPLKALAIVKHHLEVTLSDANIAEHLGWSEAEVAEVFTASVRKHFAFRNISDPLEACENWVAGGIIYNRSLDLSRSHKIAKMLEQRL